MPDVATVVAAARAAAPVLRARAAEGEQARTMPTDLVEQLRGAGLFHLAMPDGLGGPPHEPETIVRVVEAVSAADGSAGWTLLIGNAAFLTAWLEPAVARKLLAPKPDAIVASAFAPTAARAVPRADGPGYTVSGRWTFTSGAPHADWFANGVMMTDDGEPRFIGPRPDLRFAWLPAAEVEVLDTWHAAGLRGTGSHDTAATGVTVPEELLIAPLWDPPKAPDLLYRIPFFPLLNVFMAGLALGITRGALDELETLAHGKSRRLDDVRMEDDETVQVEIGRLEAAAGAARAYVFDTVGEMWEGILAGDAPTLRQRAMLMAANQHAFRAGRDVVDTAFWLAGGGALYERSPLQRAFRDIHAAGQHMAMSLVTERTVGRVVLGQVPRTPML